MTVMTTSAVPLRHRSTVRVAGRLLEATDPRLDQESPLFAADKTFAHAHGGPITRTFVDTLPPEWGDDVIVDSSLAWLTPGLAHVLDPVGEGRTAGTRSAPRFVHELFPGASSGMRADVNRKLDVRRRWCVLGVRCGPEIAEGELSFDSVDDAAAFWLPTRGLDDRDCELEKRLARGELRRLLVEPNTLIDCGWGTLMRELPAQESGFRLILRATTADGRPVVNGLRNMTIF